MTSSATATRRRHVFRGFWHGSQLGPYELLCLRTFVAPGLRFELFTYDAGIAVPDGVVRRDANEVLPADHVMVYHSGLGAGSPSLHSNLFRYALLHQLGGWWVDLDVMLLRPDPPDGEAFYFDNGRGSIGSAVLRFPANDPMLAEAVERCRAVSENVAVWGQTGPQLMGALVTKHGRHDNAFPPRAVFPVDYHELDMLFDPARCEEVIARCAGSPFFHLFNQFNRSSGVPRDAGPPEGSFLDRMFRHHEMDIGFEYRVRHAEVKTWFDNFLGHMHYELHYRQQAARVEELETRLRALE